jgi:hypothetical protein
MEQYLNRGWLQSQPYCMLAVLCCYVWSADFLARYHHCVVQFSVRKPRIRSDCMYSVFSRGDLLCVVVVTVSGYGSSGPVSIPGATSASGTGSTQPREYN